MKAAAAAIELLREFKTSHARTVAQMQALRALSLALASALPAETQRTVAQALQAARLEGASPSVLEAFEAEIAELTAALRASTTRGG